MYSSTGENSAAVEPSSQTSPAEPGVGGTLQTNATGGDITLNMLYNAIQILYSDKAGISPADKHNASAFLDQFQRSIHAWTLADQLLYHGPDLNTRYFGSHTLRTKIQNSFYELPPESHAGLRDSLLQHVKNINIRTENSVVNQLCLAVAQLVLQASTWADPISQLLTSLGADPQHWWALLEILAFLPEEAYSRKLHLGENRRNQVVAVLEAAAHAVLQFCKQCLSSCSNGKLQELNVPTDNVLIGVLNSFKSWVPINPEIFCSDQPGEILGFAVGQLRHGRCSQKIHDAATDCVTAVVIDIPDPESTGNNNVIDFHGLQNALFHSIMSFEEAYHFSVAEEDMDKTLNYAKIFSDYSESMIPCMVRSWRNPHFAIRSIDLVLICEGHHDYEVAEVTFPFWYKLSETVYHAHDESLNRIFRPYALRCIQAMYKHCYIEADHEGPLQSSDEFYEFRRRVSELVEDIVFMIGSLATFHELGIQLMNSEASWYSVEAALFLMITVAKFVDMSDTEIIEPIIKTVLSWTTWKHICVRITAVKFIGAMSVWFHKHPGEYLLQAMSFLANSLEFSEASNAAGAALLNMCQNCAEEIAPRHLDSLLGLLEQMDRYNVSNDAVIGLLRGLGHVVGNLPNERLPIVLKQICYAQLIQLNTLADNEPSNGERNTKVDPTFWVDRLSALFRSTDIDLKPGQEHPCQKVICEDVWPVISKVCNRFQADARVMERVCRCLRYAVRCVGKHSHPFIEPLVSQLVVMYAQHHHSCFLYLGSILVDEYGTEEACVPGLLHMLESFYLPTFQFLKDPQGLRNNPDTVDDFFRLCVRYLQHCPVPLLQSQVFVSILQLAQLGINLDHREANTSVMKFISEMVYQGRKQPKENASSAALNELLQRLLQQQGQSLVFTCLYAVVFNLPSPLIIGICDFYYHLKEYAQNEMSVWLEGALRQLPNKNPTSGEPYATIQQLEELHQQVLSSRTQKEMSRYVKDFCRLYR